MSSIPKFQDRWNANPLINVLLRVLACGLLAAPPLYYFLDGSAIDGFKRDFGRYFDLGHLNTVLPGVAGSGDGNPGLGPAEVPREIRLSGTSNRTREGNARAGRGHTQEKALDKTNSVPVPSSPSPVNHNALFGCLGVSFAIVLAAGRFLIRANFVQPMAKLEEEVKLLRQNAESSGQRTEDLVDTIRSGVLVLGRDMKVLAANRVCQESLGLRLDPKRETKLEDLFPSSELRQTAVEVLLTGVPARNLQLRLRPQGAGSEVRVCEFRLSLTRSACTDGEYCVIVAFEDTSDFAALRGSAADSERRFEELFNRSTDGVILLDENNLIADFNPVAQRLFGYSRDEALGKSPSAIIQRVAHLAASPGAPSEIEAKRKQGDTFPAEWISHPLPGSKKLSIANIRDLSVNKRVKLLEQDCLHVLEMVTNSKPLEAVLRQLAALVEAHDPSLLCAVSVMRDGRLHYDAAHSLPEEFVKAIEGLPMGPKACSCGAAAYSRETVIVADIANDPLWTAHRHLAFAHNLHASWSSPIFSGLGTVIGTVAIFRQEPGAPDPGQLDLLELASRLASVAMGQCYLTERLVHQANYDALTNLPNRVLFEERLRRAVAEAQRNGERMAVLYVDLDRFKLVNDTLGHGLGDMLLSQVTKRLQSALRRSDMLARMGGDEFAIIVQDLRDPHVATQLAHKLLDVLKSPFDLEGYELFVTASVGISSFPEDGRDVATLLRNADSAMYRAKDKGKNGFQYFAPEMSVRARERLDVESHLHRALERDEMSLYYQPQYEIETGRLVALESLLRWKHPKLGVVLPGKFIPAAEESGLIVPIGDWVLRQASLQNRVWQDSGHPEVTVAVNVSARQFEHPNFVDSLVAVLSDSGLNPRLLELELTETMVLQDVEKFAPRLSELRDLGVQIAIDDFGAGYSSLNYLQRLPFDILKLDKSFVDGIKTGSSAPSLIESIVGMTHNLGMLVTAEGVETEAQLDSLSRAGCDRVQGYLLSKPMPIESTEQLLRGRMGLDRLKSATVEPVPAAG